VKRLLPIPNQRHADVTSLPAQIVVFSNKLRHQARSCLLERETRREPATVCSKGIRGGGTLPNEYRSLNVHKRWFPITTPGPFEVVRTGIA
jgi:hypothetical protein